MKIKISVSAGELTDRISILEIKLMKIRDRSKLSVLRKEYSELSRVYSKLLKIHGKRIDDLKKKLLTVNLTLWNTENSIRKLESDKDFGKCFIGLARKVYITNDKRASLKNMINELTGSLNTEIKQYPEYT